MTKQLRHLVVAGSTAALLTLGGLCVFQNETDTEVVTSSVEEQRKKHQEFLDQSPFTESLSWDKQTRKQNGLPPNKYYEQLWELTINPSTGKLEDGKLQEIQKELEANRTSRRTPGETGNAWEERGPNNVGGRTRAILFDPNDASNNTVYAGGVSGGLWKNTNISSSSSQWVRVANVPGNLSVSSITVDPNNSNIWYVGTGEQYTAGDVVGSGVYKTTNGGTTWTAVNIPPAGGGSFSFNSSNLFLDGLYYVNDVIAWNNNGNTELFVGVGAHVYGDASNPTNWLGLQTAGIYRSTNGGSTWSRIESSNMSFAFGGKNYYFIPNDFEIGADNKLWMGTITTPGIGGNGGGRVFSSTNGSTWTEAAASPLTDSNRVELEPSSTNPNVLYALTQGSSSPVHIYKTTNGFGSISATSLPNDADTGISANDFTRGQSFYNLVIEADPANDNIVYVGGIDLFKSTNGGSSWSQLSHWYGGFGQPNNVHADQHAIAFGNNSSSRMVFGNDGGMYYSGNAGGSIGVRNNGYNVTQFVKAGIGPDGSGDTNGIFTAGAQDNGTQAFKNAGPGVNSSTELSDGDGFYTFVDKDGQYMIATYVYNVIYRFNLPWNGLGRRQGGATSLMNDSSSGDFVNPMDYDSDANRLLTNGSQGSNYAIKSINVASNSNGTLTNTALSSKPTAFRASPFQSNVWYVGTQNGSLLRLSNVTNSSASFSAITTPFVGSVSSIRFGETANDLIVTMHNYGVTSIWYSSDAGANWTSKEGNLPNIPVRDFLQNPLSRNEAIVATQLGVWRTSDFDASNPSWTQAYNGMSDASVTSFDYWAVNGDDTNNKIIASTYGRGVFTGTFTANSTADTQAPSAPTNLAASNITENAVRLNWTASTDNVGVANYDVYRGTTRIATVTGTTHQVNGLTAGTAYSFKVVAKDAAGNESADSNTVNVTTLAPDTTAPSAPTNLSASNTTDSSTTLSWSASSDNIAVTAYEVYRGSTLIATVSGTSYQVAGLSANTNYTFTVIAKDEAGNQSDASNPVSITTEATAISYCASASSNVNDEYISRVRLNTIDNTSGAQFYSDFTGQSTSLTKGSQYTITITPTWTGTVYSEGYAVWIDYNKDGDFTDSGEQVFTQSATQATSINGSFSVSTSAQEVTTRMRVSMKYNGVPTSCESFTYGEVEDYTVTIEGSGPDTTAPVITLNGPSTVQLNVGDSYTEQGATATDNVDGNLTSSIVITGSVNTNSAGTYTRRYNVSDAAGNAADQVTRTVVVNSAPADTVKPVITLNGSSTIELTQGDTYSELGATATDNVDGNLTSSIVITGSVNTAVVGSYTRRYNVTDAAGNAANEVTRTVNVNKATSGGDPTTLSEGYFETGLDGWIDGGSDCARVSTSRSYEGSYSIRFRDNSGAGSTMTSPVLNLTPHSAVELTFYFYAYSMENGEDFFVQYFNGSSWTTIASYASGSNFNNNTFYSATLNLDASQFNFASNSRFRIQCDASTNADQVYIDQVTIIGDPATSPLIAGAGAKNPLNPIREFNTDDEFDSEEDFMLFPNPVKGNELNVKLRTDGSLTYRVLNINGRQVMKGKLSQNKINVSDLQSGLYFLELNDGEEPMVKKFVRQ